MKRLLLLVCLFAAEAQTSATDSVTGLKIAPGWELVRAHCGGCHSHALITGQRADRDTWLRMIRWMQDSQNLWQFPADTESAILDYLASSYPAREDRRRAPIPPHLLPPKRNLGQP